MTFIWEEDEPAFNAFEFSSLKCLQALFYRYAEVFFTVNYHNWCVPLIDFAVGRELQVLFWRRLVPVRASQVPVGKKQFFCASVPALHVEEAAVGDERFKTSVVHTG